MVAADAKQLWDNRYRQRAMVSPLDFTHKAWGYLASLETPQVLDVGCGDGRDSLYFAEHGCVVTAIDFSHEAISRLQQSSPEIKAQVMDILDMDFADESFDAVYAHLSVHYFDDAATTLIFENIYRMLKPGGFFFVKCKSIRDRLYGKGEPVGPDMFNHNYVRHFFSTDYMTAKLDAFTIIEVRETESTYDETASSFIEAVAMKSI